MSNLDTRIAALKAEKDRKLAAAAREAKRKERELENVLIDVTPTKSMLSFSAKPRGGTGR